MSASPPFAKRWEVSTRLVPEPETNDYGDVCVVCRSCGARTYYDTWALLCSGEIYEMSAGSVLLCDEEGCE